MSLISTKSTTATRWNGCGRAFFKVYNQTLCKLGDNDVRVEHTGVGERQRDGTLETAVKYDAEAFSAAWDYLADSD